jgi:hypothetical protein
VREIAVILLIRIETVLGKLCVSDGWALKED